MLSRFSHVRLFVILWTVTCQAPLVMEFSRQAYWSGLPCPPPGDLPCLGIKLTSPALAGGVFTTEPLGSPQSRCFLLKGKQRGFLKARLPNTDKTPFGAECSAAVLSPVSLHDSQAGGQGVGVPTRSPGNVGAVCDVTPPSQAQGWAKSGELRGQLRSAHKGRARSEA